MKSKPFSKEEVEELPKGFTPAKLVGRKYRRGFFFDKLAIDTLGNIVTKKTMNCRKLKNSPKSNGRKTYRSKLFGRITPEPVYKQEVEQENN